MVYHPSRYSVPSFNQTKDNRYKKFIGEILGNPENSRSDVFEEKLRVFYSARELTNPMPVETISDLLQTNFIVGEN